MDDRDPPGGEQLRTVLRFEHEAPGSLVHLDTKKLGRIPAAGSRRAHSRETGQHDVMQVLRDADPADKARSIAS